MKTEKIKTKDDAMKILRQHNLADYSLSVAVANALIKTRLDGMNNPGDCSTCRWQDWDGELGTIQSCGLDDMTLTSDDKLEIGNDIFEVGECPKWSSNADPGFCDKHKRWYFQDWELACPDCFTEYAEKAKTENITT